MKSKLDFILINQKTERPGLKIKNTKGQMRSNVEKKNQIDFLNTLNILSGEDTREVVEAPLLGLASR